MPDTIRTKSIYELSIYQKVISLLLVFLVGVVVFYVFPTPSIDWRSAFYQSSQIPFSPYKIKTFINPPWIVLFLFPLHYFSENVSIAINASLNLTVIGLLVMKRRGSAASLALALTSFPFLSLLMAGNIEWIPAIGFILHDGWGVSLLLAKPQSGILAALSWVLSIKNKVSFLLPVTLVLIISFVVWGNWPIAMLKNVQYVKNAEYGLSNWNFSQFPWSIPLGLGLLFYIVKYRPVDSEIFGVLATLCLVPYFGPQSLTIFFTLVSISRPRIATVLWFLLWSYPVLTHQSFFIKLLGIH